MTLRILAVNVVAPLVLALGILYMGQYRDSLIAAELGTLKAQAQLYAGALAEGAVRPVQQGRPFLFAKPDEIETLVPELARRMVRRLGETSRTRLFDGQGRMIADSQGLGAVMKQVQGAVLRPPTDSGAFTVYLYRLANDILAALPMRKNPLPLYPATTSERISHYPDALLSRQKNDVAGRPWSDSRGNVILAAAAPIKKSDQILGVVMLTRGGETIERAMMQVRFNILTVFTGVLSITIFLSLYLAGVIGRPLTRLARVAETIRQNKGRQVDIPDMSTRGDEIGELSESFRAMTQALWDRMDSIEAFAADVAHELKNPLTSLRSAVETLGKIKNEGDRARLMAIVVHDVQRMDRLISDISNASRLDAELSRDEMGIVDIGNLLTRMTAARPDGDNMVLSLPPGVALKIRGNEGRLGQVFDNLIANAVSFSPPGRPVIIKAARDGNLVKISVSDEGPGIPEAKLETIFERFYTERPQHEAFGHHSGLGLSIARQIVTSHGGRIEAENIRDDQGHVKGARFIVTLEVQA